MSSGLPCLRWWLYWRVCRSSARPAGSTPGCSVQATNYLGWTAEELANPWVKLEIVPQIGGRLIQVTFGGHDFLYVNPNSKGKVIPLARDEAASTTTAETRYGRYRRASRTSSTGPAGADLDSGPFTLQVLSRGPTCAVRLTGPVNPEIGQRYIRDISIGADTPVISFHVVMQNMSGFPQTWSEQTITEYPTSDPAGSDHFNTKFWGVTAVNPDKRVSQRLPCAHRPGGEPGFLGQRWHVTGALERHRARGLDRLSHGMAGGRGWHDRIHHGRAPPC